MTRLLRSAWAWSGLVTVPIVVLFAAWAAATWRHLRMSAHDPYAGPWPTELHDAGAEAAHHLLRQLTQRLRPSDITDAPETAQLRSIQLFVNDEGPPFLDTVRTPDKKEVMRLVHQEFLDEIRRTDITVHRHPLSADELSTRVAAGAIPVVLISQYRIYGDKEPHWIIVSGCDQRFIYAHDPYISEAHVTTTDRVSIPILRREFELMARYGRSRLQAAIIVSKRDDAR